MRNRAMTNEIRQRRRAAQECFLRNAYRFAIRRNCSYKFLGMNESNVYLSVIVCRVGVNFSSADRAPLHKDTHTHTHQNGSKLIGTCARARDRAAALARRTVTSGCDSWREAAWHFRPCHEERLSNFLRASFGTYSSLERFAIAYRESSFVER